MSYLDTLNRVLQGDYADATDEEREAAVAEVVQVCAVAAGAVAIQPFPLVDLVLVTPIQVGMVQAIGRIFGHRLDEKSVVEILSTFGASLVAQNLIVAAAKLIPFAGWVAGVAMSYALTWAIGDVSAEYFRKGRGVKPEDLRARFDKVFRQKRDEKIARHKSNTTLKERLAELKEAHEAGLIDAATFEAKKQEMLSSF